MNRTEEKIQDHDLLIRLDENVRNLVLEIKLFRDGLTLHDARIRTVEDVVIKLSPIPSVSHQQVVDDINTIKFNIEKLRDKNIFLSGGWRAILVTGGSLLGIASFIWTTISVLGLIHFR